MLCSTVKTFLPGGRSPAYLAPRIWERAILGMPSGSG